MAKLNTFRSLLGCLVILFLHSAYAIDTTDHINGWAKKIWGTPSPEPMLALGMWSYHLKHESEDMDNSRNNLIGFSYKGLFGATFVNSENRRSYAVGIQRYWVTEPLKADFTWQLGYRLGLVYGYDDKLGRIATITPVVPFPQVISDLTWKNFGWEVSYTWVVVSTGFYIRF